MSGLGTLARVNSNWVGVKGVYEAALEQVLEGADCVWGSKALESYSSHLRAAFES